MTFPGSKTTNVKFLDIFGSVQKRITQHWHLFTQNHIYTRVNKTICLNRHSIINGLLTLNKNHISRQPALNYIFLQFLHYNFWRNKTHLSWVSNYTMTEILTVKQHSDDNSPYTELRSVRTKDPQSMWLIGLTLKWQATSECPNMFNSTRNRLQG